MNLLFFIVKMVIDSIRRVLEQLFYVAPKTIHVKSPLRRQHTPVRQMTMLPPDTTSTTYPLVKPDTYVRPWRQPPSGATLPYAGETTMVDVSKEKMGRDLRTTFGPLDVAHSPHLSPMHQH